MNQGLRPGPSRDLGPARERGFEARAELVVAPALRRIGDDWAAGKVSIAQEHRASAICERLIALHAGQPGGRPRGRAVVATPPGERHGLPALMAAACLREDRWLVHH